MEPSIRSKGLHDDSNAPAAEPLTEARGADGGHPRIAYVINSFPNLIETMIYREVEALRGRGYEVHTFSIRRPDDGLVPPEALHLSATTSYILPLSAHRLLIRHLAALIHYPLRYWRILFEVLSGTHTGLRDRVRTLCHFAEAVTLLPTVQSLKLDHLHAHWAVGSATIAMVVSRFLGIPFSFTAHAYDIWRERLLLPEKLQAAEMAVTCTDCNRQHLISAYGGDPAKVRVVHHGLDVDKFRPARRSPKTEPVILSVGRLVEQKGFDCLIRACAALAADGHQFQCRIIGDGPLRPQLEGLAAELRLNGRVQFLGKMHQEELMTHYAAADIFALLCRPASDDDRDGIPNTLIEAMAMELPAVSTRFSGVPELVIDGETGLLVETDDHHAAVTVLRDLLADPARRLHMGQAGRQRVCAAFTIQASAAKLDEAFAGLLAQRTGA